MSDQVIDEDSVLPTEEDIQRFKQSMFFAGLDAADPAMYDSMIQIMSGGDPILEATAKCAELAIVFEQIKEQITSLALQGPFLALSETLNCEAMINGRAALLQFLQADLLVAAEAARPAIEALTVLFNGLTLSIDGVVLRIMSGFQNTLVFFQEFFANLLILAGEQWTLVIEGLEHFTDMFGGMFTNLFDSSLNQFSFFKTLLTQGWSAAWSGLQDITMAKINQIVNSINGMVNTAIDRINSLLNFVNKVGGSLGLNVNWQVPKFEDGGWVGKTGLAVVHEGEFVLSKAMLNNGQTGPTANSGQTNMPITINAQINNQLDLQQVAQALAWQISGRTYL